MAYHWWFASFEAERLFELFADPSGPAVVRMVALAPELQTRLVDPPTAVRVVQTFLASGLSYDDLSLREATAADDLVPEIFSPRGFGAELLVEPLSPAGIPQTLVRELVTRLPSASALKSLISGRRAGQDQPSACAYVVLEPAEVALLIHEVEAALAVWLPWESEGGPQMTRDLLLAPLRDSVGAWVFGQLV